MLSKCYGLWVGSVREIWFWSREKEMGLWLAFERERKRNLGVGAAMCVVSCNVF